MILDRFLKFIIIEDNGCWIWQGAKNRKGYGQFRVEKLYIATRWALEFIKNSPPSESQQACHTCDTPSCVNPDHLFWGTNTENSMDMLNKNRFYNQKKTHCKQGHPYDEQNTLVIKTKSGLGKERQCRTCKRASTQRWKAKTGYSESRKTA